MQARSRAMHQQDRVHQLEGAYDRIHRAGLNAQSAAMHQLSSIRAAARGCFLAVAGFSGLTSHPVRAAARDSLAARRALVDVRLAAGYGVGVRSAAR
jgi:hypothetical protein